MLEVYLQTLTERDANEKDLGCGIAVSRFPFVIGRQDDCDYRICHRMISRRHCRFFVHDEEVWVIDQHSRNGTYLNGKLVREARCLSDGSLLNLAHLYFFEVHRPASSLTGTICGGPVEPEKVHAQCSRNVLVVEDNEDAAQTLALVLNRWGHKVWVAHSGSEALEVAEAQQPDTVLLDIHLSGMDGRQVAERLRNQEGMEKTRIVAITGYDPDRVPCPSGETGYDSLLTKPVDPDVLRDVLR